MRDCGRGLGMTVELPFEYGLMDVSIYRRCSFPSLFIIEKRKYDGKQDDVWATQKDQFLPARPEKSTDMPTLKPQPIIQPPKIISLISSSCLCFALASNQSPITLKLLSFDIE